MTLADSIATTSGRTLYSQVRINDIPLSGSPSVVTGALTPYNQPGIRSISIRKSFDSPVPVCTIETTRLPASIVRGQVVEVDLGFDGLYNRVFTGWVQSVEPEHGAGKITCSGRLYGLFRMSETSERDLDGLTVQQALENILDYVGITSSYRNLISIPSWTLGSASDAVLERMRVSNMLQLVMQLEGLRLYETGAGTVVIRKFDSVAYATPFRTYDTANSDGIGILSSIRRREDPEAIRTRVTVTGATLVEGTAPNETSRTIEVTASLIDPVEWVFPPLPNATYIDEEISNSLIDTDAKAGEVAARILTELSQAPQQLEIEVTGDPEIELGQSIRVVAAENGLDDRWIVHGVEHRLDSNGYSTSIDLRGSEHTAGDIGINPVADFFYMVDREVIGDRVYAVVTFDARGSHDPDGDIASYAWSDDETTTPEISTITTPQATVRIDPSTVTGTWDVTLTVTDDDGLTGTITRSIDIADTDSVVVIPAIYAAIGNNHSATPDGGQNWNDESAGAETVISVAARPWDDTHGQAVFGTVSGKIYRTTDFIGQAPTLVTSSPGADIVDILWHRKNPAIVWALTDTFVVWISGDYGETWAQLKDLASWFSITGEGRKLLARDDGSVWAFGGNGSGSAFIAFTFNGSIWTQYPYGGELNTDMPHTDNACRVVDATDADNGGGMAIILENANGTSGKPAIYHTPDVWNTGGWKRATGLDAGLVDGKWVVPETLPARFYAGFDDRNVWYTTDGVAWSKRTDVLPANHYANHAIWLPSHVDSPFLASSHLLACEDTVSATGGIYKSTNDLQTVGAVRPATGFDAWPSSAVGKKVSVGRAFYGDDAKLMIMGVGSVTNDVFAAWKYRGGNWDYNAFTTVSQIVVKARPATSSVWFGFMMDTETDFNGVVALRTKDSGATWDNPYAVPDTGRVWQDIKRAADGRLWGVSAEATDLDHMEIWYNDDPEGDGSWTEAKDDNPVGGTQRMFMVLPHPTNPNRIAIFGVEGANRYDLKIWFTTDRGATWSSNVVTNLLYGLTSHGASAMMLPNNRLVYAGNEYSTNYGAIWTSDDNGNSWTKRATISEASALVSGPTGSRNGGRLYVMAVTSGTPINHDIYESRDSGLTWTNIENDPPLPANDDRHDGGIAYDERVDALYTWGAGEANADNILQVVRLCPVRSTTEWEDISGHLLPMGSDTSYRTWTSPPQGIAVIP